MDPDMVRQQAEAEREALALLRKKPAAPAPASAAAFPHAVVTTAVQDVATALHQVTAPQTFDAALTAGAVLQEPAAALPEVPPPEPQAGVPAPRRRGASMAAQFGRFISFGLAGAMLGGGLGILIAEYMQLPAALAKLAIFGPAAFFAGACAIASVYTKPSHE
jgi:hypothetical protein